MGYPARAKLWEARPNKPPPRPVQVDARIRELEPLFELNLSPAPDPGGLQGTADPASKLENNSTRRAC